MSEMTRDGDVIDIEDFAARARAWLSDNMPSADPNAGHFFLTSSARSDDEDLRRIAICRELQRRLYEGGFAGICVPEEYGGQGLTPAHQAAFNREIRGYDYPAEIQASTFIPALALLLEFGSDEQKQRHIPAMLRGEEIWVQFLSEPGGGSDAAGAVTTAVRDGNNWILNGSKIWTTGAWYGDWAICLARTNWEVEKHRGLTVFSFPVRTPGVDIHRIELLNGSHEFCQEFLTDVVVADDDRIGDIDAGWSVVTRWLFHERSISGGSPYVTGTGNRPPGGPQEPAAMLKSARARDVLDHGNTLELIGEAGALSMVGEALIESVSGKIQSGAVGHHAAAVLRLYSGVSNVRKATIAYELGCENIAVWRSGEDAFGHVGIGYLMRQAGCIGGGTTEMARNVISERVLGMPREARGDLKPFKDVPRGPLARTQTDG